MSYNQEPLQFGASLYTIKALLCSLIKPSTTNKLKVPVIAQFVNFTSPVLTATCRAGHWTAKKNEMMPVDAGLTSNHNFYQ